MKEIEPDDPMELVGVGLPEGDVDYMAECLIEEFMLLGWSERQVMGLFSRPFYGTMHRIYLEKGEDHVRALIQRVGDTWRQGCMRGATSDA